MKNFWESSPEWQRKQELEAAWEATEKAEAEAAYLVLFGIRYEALRGKDWHRNVEAYKAAADATSDALGALNDAIKAFNASPAGQARARYRRDPLAFRATEPEAA